MTAPGDGLAVRRVPGGRTHPLLVGGRRVTSPGGQHRDRLVPSQSTPAVQSGASSMASRAARPAITLAALPAPYRSPHERPERHDVPASVVIDRELGALLASAAPDVRRARAVVTRLERAVAQERAVAEGRDVIRMTCQIGDDGRPTLVPVLYRRCGCDPWPSGVVAAVQFHGDDEVSGQCPRCGWIHHRRKDQP